MAKESDTFSRFMVLRAVDIFFTTEDMDEVTFNHILIKSHIQ
jgi:hypothetical protein